MRHIGRPKIPSMLKRNSFPPAKRLGIVFCLNFLIAEADYSFGYVRSVINTFGDSSLVSFL